LVNPDLSPNALLDRLEECAARTRRIEEEALKSLERGAHEAYRGAMRRKAELLLALPGEARPLLEGFAPHARRDILERLEGFAKSAGTALSLNSTFYMSALLYPENHRKGEPNNLEVFLGELRKGIFR
jgi:hypothetical protein